MITTDGKISTPRMKNGTATNKIVRKRLSSIRPAPENDEIYRPIDPSSPEIHRLAESIKKHGIKEPLVLTLDSYILSGHRRYAAAKLLGQVTVPCRIERIKRTSNLDRFVELLREYNRQRDKTLDEKLREELITINPDDAYCSLIEQRDERARIDVPTVTIEGKKHRSRITDAKRAMLDAAKQIIFVDRRHYWPLTVRTIHYALLNDPPLRHSNKPTSTYDNDKHSSGDLSDLLTRARLAGIVPWEAITDETPPRALWNVWADPRAFIREQLDEFLKGYWRDLMQSQPNHIEVIVEKNTAWPIVKRITSQYCIPTMSGRGFSSIDPYHDIEQRFVKSGKENLIIIVASDFDPEGEEIVQVAGRTLRDDFGIPSRKLEIIKVAVTPQQIDQYDLPPNLEAKKSSSRYKKFVAKHGKNVYELEALTPEQLQDSLTEAIDSVIDIEAFNSELAAEKQDAAFLQGVRHTIVDTLKGLDFIDE